MCKRWTERDDFQRHADRHSRFRRRSGYEFFRHLEQRGASRLKWNIVGNLLRLCTSRCDRWNIHRIHGAVVHRNAHRPDQNLAQRFVATFLHVDANSEFRFQYIWFGPNHRSRTRPDHHSPHISNWQQCVQRRDRCDIRSARHVDGCHSISGDSGHGTFEPKRYARRHRRYWSLRLMHPGLANRNADKAVMNPASEPIQCAGRHDKTMSRLARGRTESGRKRKKRNDTLVETLQDECGKRFAPRFSGAMELGTLKVRIGLSSEASLDDVLRHHKLK